MRGPALGCGFFYRRRGFAPGSRAAIGRGPIERADVNPSPADDTDVNPGSSAAEAGGCLQAAGPRPVTHGDSSPVTQATRGANAEAPAVGAGASALAVAAHLGVAAVGRRRWPAPPLAYPPLLAAAIPSEGRSIPYDPWVLDPC